MIQNYYLNPSSLVNEDFHTLFVKPYSEGLNNLKVFWYCNEKDYKRLIIGCALLIPIVNTLALLVLKKLYTTVRANALQINVPEVVIESEIKMMPEREEEEEKEVNSREKQEFLGFLQTYRSYSPAPKPAIIAPLNECGCIGNRRAREIEEIFFRQAELFSKDQPFNYVSFGSGALLQDWMLVAGLVQRGFKHFKLHFIDIEYEKPKQYKYSQPDVLKKAFEDSLRVLGVKSLAIEMHIDSGMYLVRHPEEPIDALMTIDVCKEYFLDSYRLQPGLLVRDKALLKTHAFAIYHLPGSRSQPEFLQTDEIAQQISVFSFEELEQMYLRAKSRKRDLHPLMYLREIQYVRGVEPLICQPSKPLVEVNREVRRLFDGITVRVYWLSNPYVTR